MSIAYAATEAAGHAAEAAEAAHGGGEAFYVAPEFWVAIAFFIFIGAIAKPVWKMLTTSLDDRAAKIRDEIDEAAKLREEAQTLLAEYQRRQRSVKQEAEDIAAAAKEEAERHREEAAEALEANLVRREQMAVERIAQAESAALAEVRNMAADLAIDATRKLIADQLDEAKAAELVDAAVAELPGKLH